MSANGAGGHGQAAASLIYVLKKLEDEETKSLDLRRQLEHAQQSSAEAISRLGTLEGELTSERVAHASTKTKLVAKTEANATHTFAIEGLVVDLANEQTARESMKAHLHKRKRNGDLDTEEDFRLAKYLKTKVDILRQTVDHFTNVDVGTMKEEALDKELEDPDDQPQFQQGPELTISGGATDAEVAVLTQASPRGKSGQPYSNKDKKPHRSPLSSLKGRTKVQKPPHFEDADWMLMNERTRRLEWQIYRVDKTTEGRKARRRCNRCQGRNAVCRFLMHPEGQESTKCSACQRNKAFCEGAEQGHSSDEE